MRQYYWILVVSAIVSVCLVIVTSCNNGGSLDRDGGPDMDTDTASDTGCKAESAPEYTWCDESMGLLWENPHMDAPGGCNWSRANFSCPDLTLGGFDDWHMPTIDELRTLVKECPGTEHGGDCEVTQLCLGSECAGSACDGCPPIEGPGGDGCYWDDDLLGDWFCKATVYWSSSPVEDQTDHHWGILFGTGAVLSESDIDTDTDSDTDTMPLGCNTIVRCVRGSL